MPHLQSLEACDRCSSTTVSVCFSCCRIVHTVMFDSWEIIGPYRAWWLLNGLLLVLQTLHIIWFYLIARIAIKAIFKGKVSLSVWSDKEIILSHAHSCSQTVFLSEWMLHQILMNCN